MQVTVIGAGNMGRGIGHRLVAGGHDVTVVDRDPEEAGRLAEELRGAAEEGATVESAGPDAELRGEVVILAVYYPGSLELARDLGRSEEHTSELQSRQYIVCRLLLEKKKKNVTVKKRKASQC